ncbi:hypothetical protein cand_000960 [Cryptosporidium andersoni]|uniref:Uncharacterized protein n=1 Tax=Cryptosporidium andersoni TaxID=117008 RepID=A0A1J4MR87_9CRYT|nr:hypothetical protein cand_000960 [Cryptosporidium andersoni]
MDHCTKSHQYSYEVPVVDNWEDLLDSDNEEDKNSPINSLQKYPDLKSPNIANNKIIKDQNSNLIDELSEEMRCQKLTEEMDESAMDDLFDGFITTPSKFQDQKSISNTKLLSSTLNVSSDPFISINLNSYGKVEAIALKFADKIRPALAKSPAWLRFIDICLNEIFPKMDLKDLKTLKKKVDQQIQIKEKDISKSQQKKKPSDVSTLSRNYKEELDIFDGIDSLDEESDEY